jgi:hypothetical protein
MIDIINYRLTRAIYDYRLEPGDIDIIIALLPPQFMIILNLVISILSLDTRRNLAIIASHLVISILLSP